MFCETGFVRAVVFGLKTLAVLFLRKKKGSSPFVCRFCPFLINTEILILDIKIILI